MEGERCINPGDRFNGIPEDVSDLVSDLQKVWDYLYKNKVYELMKLLYENGFDAEIGD